MAAFFRITILTWVMPMCSEQALGVERSRVLVVLEGNDFASFCLCLAGILKEQVRWLNKEAILFLIVSAFV